MKSTSLTPALGSALAREAEDALADDVALDLRGTGGDGQVQPLQPLLRPASARGARQVVQRNSGALGEPGGYLVQLLPGFGVPQLEDRAAGAGPAGAGGLADHPQDQRPDALELGTDVGEFAAQHLVVPGGAGTAGGLAGEG